MEIFATMAAGISLQIKRSQLMTSDASTLSEGLVGNGVFCLETTGADATVCNTAAAPDADVEATDTTLTLKQAGDSTL